MRKVIVKDYADNISLYGSQKPLPFDKDRLINGIFIFIEKEVVKNET